MSRNYELDQLKSAEQALFQRKQEAFQCYARLREQASLAHAAMQDAWEERTRARERMNREFEARQNAFEHRNSVWEEYQRIRDDNNRQIEHLRSEADYEHQAMQDCFERASNAYEYGDKSEAPIYAEEGRDHKERRNELNDEVSRLIQEIKDAKSYAEMRAPRVDSSAFNSAKGEFEWARQCHESAQDKFKRLKSSRDEAKAEFDHLQEEFLRAKEAFQTKLNEVRARTKAETSWEPHIRGFIGNHPVTVRKGTGANAGQTLISDGHVSGKEFNRHHNHYGKNDRTKYPNEPARIEDSTRHKKDRYYTGPGH